MLNDSNTETWEACIQDSQRYAETWIINTFSIGGLQQGRSHRIGPIESN